MKKQTPIVTKYFAESTQYLVAARSVFFNWKNLLKKIEISLYPKAWNDGKNVRL